MRSDAPLKVIVIGGVAGGASAAARIRRLDEQAEITVFEKGEHASFSNCCLPYHLSGIVEDSDDLIMMTPTAFKKRYNIDVLPNREAVKINRAAHTVTVRSTLDGTENVYPYDKLVLSPGAEAVVPDIPGADGPQVYTVRNVADIRRLKARLDAPETEHIIVYGGGPVGIELAENMRLAGKQVTVLQRSAQILSAFDYDMVQLLNKELHDNGICLRLNTKLTAIHSGSVEVRSEAGTETLPADAVVLAAGVKPNTTLAADAGLKLTDSGAIVVDRDYRSSDPDIYAVGDAVEVYMHLTHSSGKLALAGPAQMEARAAADSICGRSNPAVGFIGSSCIKVFGLNAAATGLNEKTASRAGYRFDSVLLFPGDKVGIMPDSHYMAFKLLFELPTGRLLGAQAIGKGDAVGRVNVIAALLKCNATLEDLKNTELCYSPVYGTAKDVVNMAALVGLNILNGEYRQVHVNEVRALAEAGACIIDVREEREFAAGHIIGAKNIPLTQLRQRVDEIPRDVPVYLHCRSSQRSYYALCCLRGLGYTNLFNISGSYLGMCLYEYFDDISTGRKPIFTAYNFN